MFHLSLHHGRFTPPLLLVYNIFPSKACILQVLFSTKSISIPIGSMYAIYGDIYHQYTPNVSIYTSTMDPMGCNFWFLNFFFPWIDRISWIDYPVGDKSSPLAFDLASAALRSLGHGGAAKSAAKKLLGSTNEHRTQFGHLWFLWY